MDGLRIVPVENCVRKTAKENPAIVLVYYAGGVRIPGRVGQRSRQGPVKIPSKSSFLFFISGVSLGSFCECLREKNDWPSHGDRG